MSSSSSSTVNHANEACLASTTEMCLKVSDMDFCVGRLEAAVMSRESTNQTPTNSSCAVLVYAQQVRQVFDNMKGTIVDPLTGLTRILSEPDQPTTDTKFKCIQPHCKFLTSSSIDMEKHDQQVHQQNPKNELEPIENDGQIGDGSPSASTSTPPPPTPPSSSSTASPENNEPKLVLKRGNPLFSLIMGTLQQGEAETLQISAAELNQILGNRRFQKMTIGFSARRD